MALEIKSTQLKIIFDRAKAVYPEECCGILLGKIIGDDKIVVEAIATINAWNDPASRDFQQNNDLDSAKRRLCQLTNHSRYLIPPQAIFQAQKQARAERLEIIGFFHSHPDAPAIPSECDRSLAWDIYSYPIVSVIQSKVETIASWVLDSNSIFQIEEINIIYCEDVPQF